MKLQLSIMKKRLEAMDGKRLTPAEATQVLFEILYDLIELMETRAAKQEDAAIHRRLGEKL